jgi:hypothetical protein
MIVRRWAEAEQRRAGYDRPFAVVALGGTGRGEVTPCSDLDYALLFDDELEGNDFLMELQRQTVHSQEFCEQHGFGFEPLAFAIDDVPQLEGKQLNSFLDLAPVHDPSGLTARFRERIRTTFDPFSHFLQVRSFWQKLWEPAESERLDRFDIKNEGLRVFLAGIWTLAMDHFSHCHEIYAALEDPRDLEAYDFLLRIRCWLHMRRPRTEPCKPGANGNHVEDVMHFDDFITFGEMLGEGAPEGDRFEFGNGVRSRLLSARRRLMAFSRGIIERELRRGRPIGLRQPIVLGRGGLVYTPGFLPRTNEERSSAALSLLLAAQRYDVPVDPSELYATFRGAGDWLVRVPELAALFHETRGSLAGTFEFLAQVDGAVERLFPGYGTFESSLDARVMREKCFLRGALERRKLRALERFIADEAEQSARAVSGMAARESGEAGDAVGAIRLLDADHLAAVKLALKTKRLPLTEEDYQMRLDARRPRHERHSSGLSGIPVEEYYQRFAEEAGFSRETVEAAQFIVCNRHALANWTASGFNNTEQVRRFVEHCRNEQRLCALYVFTCADRSEWGSERVEPARWFLMRELYLKALAVFRPELSPADPLRGSGYAEQELAVLRDFGHDFLSGSYRKHALRFGTHVLQLAEGGTDADPKAAVVRDGSSTMVGVAARDWRGLAACICGALWRQGIDLHQAHLFSARNYGLALDFFHVSSPEQPVGAPQLRAVEEAIREHRYLAPEDEASLPPIAGDLTLEETHAGHFRLRLETASAVSGLVYALTYKVFHHLGGSIHGLSAYASRGHAFISVYHDLPHGQTLESAREIVRGFPEAGAAV